MSVPRGLSPDEQAAWARLAQSVTPIAGRAAPKLAKQAPAKGADQGASMPTAIRTKKSKPKIASKPAAPAPASVPRPIAPPRPTAPVGPSARAPFNSQLDSHWNRKLKAGQIAPDYTLDLHGHSLDGAYNRIISGIDQARAMGARVVLVIAGRDRGADPADRATKRGAIRAKMLDWLAASHHAEAIAAVRLAHIRHGGEGALYLVLKRPR